MMFTFIEISSGRSDERSSDCLPCQVSQWNSVTIAWRRGAFEESNRVLKISVTKISQTTV